MEYLKSATNSKLFNIVLKVGLSAAAFWLALHKVDFDALPDIFKNQKPIGLFEAVLLILLQILLGGLRWQMILQALSDMRDTAMGRWEALKIMYISVFFNCCLPGTVGGDVVRVWLAKSDHIKLPVAINSVIIDRFIALIAVSLLVLFTLPLLGQAAGFNVTFAWGVIIVLAIIGLFILKYIDQLLKPWEHIRVIHWLLYFVHCLKLLLKHPLVSLASLLYALVSHIGYCIAAYALAQSMGVEITVLQCITMVPLVVLLTTLPIAIGGWGIREAGMVGMLGLAGVPQTAALAISIQLGLISIISSLPAGLVWLAYRRKSSDMISKPSINLGPGLTK